MINNTHKELNFAKALGVYTKHWKWFVLSCVVAFTIAFFRLRYTTPEYNAYAKLMILDDQSATPAELVLEDLKNFSKSDNTNVEDEIEVITSRKLMELVVKKLELNIQYKQEGRFHFSQFFPNKKAPIKINFIESDSVIENSKLNLNLIVDSNSKFRYSFHKDSLMKSSDFGKAIKSPLGELVITPNTTDLLGFKGVMQVVSVTPLNKVAEYYKRKVLVTQAAEFSKIVNISLNDVSPTKAKMVIDTLINVYDQVSIMEKNRKATNTAKFIDERIDLIAKDLSDTDREIEQFKRGNKLTNIVSEADLFIKSSAQVERDIDGKRIEQNKLAYIKDILGNQGDSFSRIPENIGFSNNATNLTAKKFNELLDDRDRLLKSSNEKNPIIVNLDQKIANLRNNLEQSVNTSLKSVDLEIKSLQNTSSKLNSKIYAVPGQVRKSRDIEREQKTKESLYLYLLEKREESAITLTSTSPKLKIIDKAFASNIPVSPKKVIVYLASIILGFSVPFGIIYVSDLLDNKIHNKEDLEKEITNITVLGEVPHSSGRKSDKIVKKNDRSVLSESFRIIRTNVDYIKKGRNVKNYNNVIFVTSTINGEGKSFFSLNMALTFANTNKRVLLIGADIRNPQTDALLSTKKKNVVTEIGLTEYLVEDSILLGEAVNSYDVNGNTIDVLASGKVPPNPAELLMGNRMKELFDSVSEQYDYVIVDTAPAMLVTDTLLISEYAGHTIYVVRAGYTEKRILNFAKEIHDQNKLNGMMLVVNDVKDSNFGYGAKYGYYGKPQKRGWFKKSKS
ncbi:GumC family protein [Seonamhaeicola marinus]|uniref:non-specific protein-tyrosine kinase n=1 Tax=Seonamhaeicola marinus TaxID=1912246 RepID=A0A5D0HKN7_9FLAO|nr:tyrosine-protein kinase family protein [Seonamhaeicola marinus]TYA71881.1 polysaccharide biosynthesis tyrosine autokinase [Seonamhaeicola marinus]